MSDVMGNNYTKIDAAVPGDRVYAAEWDGRVRVQCDEYEASALASGSTIKVGKLPKGAQPLPISFIVHDALGTDSTIAVGDGTTAGKFAAAESTAAAGTIQLVAIGGLDVLTAVTDIVLTTGGAAITGTIRTFIFYSMP